MAQKRGRPKASNLHGLRTKVWFARASRACGFKSATWFYNQFDAPAGDRSTWERYARGLRDATNYAGRNRVALVEARFPGTAAIFYSPMWDYLAGEDLSVQQVIAGISIIGDPVATIILAGGFSDRVDETPRHIDAVFDDLETFPDFDMLTALVLMLAWADKLQNVDFWNSICAFYKHMVPYLIERGDIPFYEDVFDAIDQVARVRVFARLNVREDTFEGWREQIHRYDQLVLETAEEAKSYFDNMPKIIH